MKSTIKNLNKKYLNKEKIVCITAYDALFAKLTDEFVDIILVGDSLGMTVLGYNSTIPVTLDNIIYHTQAVARGAKKAFIVSDMPFMTANISIEETCKNAQKIMQNTQAQAIKIEGGEHIFPHIQTLVKGGIPVMGHLGILPQHYFTEGGYHIKGKSDEKKIISDALALQESGVFAIVLEGVTEDIANKITKMLSIPTIGIGAGKGCSGQIQVMHDLLGMSSYLPKHSKCYDDIASKCKEIFKTYANEVRTETFPTKENSF